MLNAKRGKKDAKMQLSLLLRRGQGEMMMSQGRLSNPLKEAEQLHFCTWERELGEELKNPVPDVLSMELTLADTNNNLG